MKIADEVNVTKRSIVKQMIDLASDEQIETLLGTVANMVSRLAATLTAPVVVTKQRRHRRTKAEMEAAAIRSSLKPQLKRRGRPPKANGGDNAVEAIGG